MAANNHIAQLFRRFLNKECSEEELQELFSYFGNADEDTLRALIRAEMRDAPENTREHSLPHPPLESEFKQKSLMGRLLPYAAALLLLALAGIGWFYIHQPMGDRQAVLESKYGNDVLPGGNQATLTLEGGKTIQLDNAGKGLITEEKNIRISKEEDGLISYKPLQNEDETLREAPVSYNTIRTPDGGKYQVLLPDGSSVWLNAASSLTYPTRFSGRQRRVVLKGEAYFEVFSDKAQPFIVSCASQEVTVSGTTFNISAYPNAEQVKTTLLEGGVAITDLATGRSEKLNPGWQSVLGSDGIRLQRADISAAIGWKSGEFVFHHEKLPEILRQLQRWYGIEVSYGERIPEDTFYGEINRDVRLSEVLDMIRSTSAVEFEIRNKKLIVK